MHRIESPKPSTWLFLAASLALQLASGCERQPAAGARATGPAANSVPSRIISIAPDATEIIAELGAADGLVGISSFCVWPPEVLARTPRVGGLFNPDLEKILGLRPDLIVLRGQNTAIERLCEDHGIRLYRDPAERLGDIYTTVKELGDLLDRTAQAERITARMRHGLERIRAVVGKRPRPRVLFTVARLSPDSAADVTTANRETFVHEMIDLAGGENVFADAAAAYPKVSPEAILAARPEVIIEAMPESDPDPELEKKIINLWKNLGPIPAAQNGRIHVLTDDNVQIPSPRVVEVIEMLARLFHPGVEI